MQNDQTTNGANYIVYTDGGCAFNPGGPGGIGVVIVDTNSGEVREISGGYFSSTNNRMEIMAVITALEELPRGSSIELYSDSQYTLNCMCGSWSRNKNTDLWSRLDKAAAGKKISLNWVRGHNGNQYNERCDELATAGQQRPTLSDNGYGSQTKPAKTMPQRPAGGAMAILVSIPENLTDTPPKGTNPGEYANERGITLTCAKAILDFYRQPNRSFKAYAAIKTGGRDQFSRQGVDALSTTTAQGAEVLDVLRAHLPDERLVTTAMRWHSRGLTIRDSIRKVLVDQEIAENCTKMRG